MHRASSNVHTTRYHARIGRRITNLRCATKASAVFTASTTGSCRTVQLSSSESHLQKPPTPTDYTMQLFPRLVLHGKTFENVLSGIRFSTTHMVVDGYYYPASTAMKLSHQSLLSNPSPLLETRCVRLSTSHMRTKTGLGPPTGLRLRSLSTSMTRSSLWRDLATWSQLHMFSIGTPPSLLSSAIRSLSYQQRSAYQSQIPTAHTGGLPLRK